ncbi:MAG: hypothetical protein B6D53_04915 [Candidatus Omnitrophica bacterium 4484_49]|nr:MAG: hypothetical protein B6D53_04915 [Candidatus Omnitrophica bacterium 4484_49]
MKFIEKKNLIKAENSEDSVYIAAFNIEKKRKSFFLSPDDWDEFTEYLVKKDSNIIPEIEYYIDTECFERPC